MELRAILFICGLFISIIEGLSNEGQKEELKQHWFYGDDGPQGWPGDKGDRGMPGPPGYKGFKHWFYGDDGPQGWPGDKGDRGMPGPPGYKGFKGEKGEQGVKGNAGIAGSDGLPGAPGYKGDKGERAIDAEKGDKGVKGKEGIGIPGRPGLPGVPGIKGFRGDTGDKGEMGVEGVFGKDGLPGFNGEKGNAGAPGAVGPPGICDIPEEEVFPQSDLLPPADNTGVCVNLPGTFDSLDTVIENTVTETKVPYEVYAIDKIITFNDSQPFWLSSKNVDMKDLYGVTHEQIALLLREHYSGNLTIRFHCLNFNPVGSNAVTLLSWNGGVVGHKSSATSRFHYSVENDGCSVAKENTWSATDVTLVSPFHQIPIVDIFIKDVNSEETKSITKAFIIEIVNLCFK